MERDGDRLLKQWDRGKKADRALVVSALAALLSPASGSPDDRDACREAAGGARWLPRLVSALWLTSPDRLHGIDRPLHVLGLLLQTHADVGAATALVRSFCVAGGVPLVVELAKSEPLHEPTVMAIVRLLSAVAVVGREDKESMWRARGLALCIRVLESTRLPELVAAVRELLLLLAADNPAYAQEVHDTCLSLLTASRAPAPVKSLALDFLRQAIKAAELSHASSDAIEGGPSVVGPRLALGSPLRRSSRLVHLHPFMVPEAATGSF